VAEDLRMHEVNWCEVCGTMIGVIQIQKPGPDGTLKLINMPVCSCRGRRPKPAESGLAQR
jgi:hypothetical protein